MSESPQARTTGTMDTSRAIRRHLPDLCLIAALLLVLAVSLDRAPASSDSRVDPRTTVQGQVGAPGSGDPLVDGQGDPPTRTIPPG